MILWLSMSELISEVHSQTHSHLHCVSSLTSEKHFQRQSLFQAWVSFLPRPHPIVVKSQPTPCLLRVRPLPALLHCSESLWWRVVTRALIRAAFEGVRLSRVLPYRNCCSLCALGSFWLLSVIQAQWGWLSRELNPFLHKGTAKLTERDTFLKARTETSGGPS